MWQNYWVGQKFVQFFYKIKNTFLVFTNNFIDLDVLSVCSLSPGVTLTVLH